MKGNEKIKLITRIIQDSHGSCKRNQKEAN